jgi:hypothetical protein
MHVSSHAKEEVTRTVVEHCSGKVRSMLESIEALKLESVGASAQGAAGGDVIGLDELALRLRSIGISNDPCVLADMSAKLQKDGIMALEDMKGFSEEEMKEEVAALNLKRVQFNKLFKAVSDL